MRSGYYEGANLDWYITYQVSGEILEDIDFFEAMQWHTNQSDAMLKKQCARAEKWAGKAKAKLIAIVEEVFTQVSTPYFKSAQFSNGEAVYTQY
jgi:tryptophanyl-tRNA synthetase